MPLLRETNQSLFPVDPYRYRPDLLDPGRYNPGEQSRRFRDASMSGMGFDFGSIFGGITGLFGSGRREADMITPTQARIFDTVLKPIIDRLNAANSSGSDVSYEELMSMQTRLDAARREWETLLAGPWDDGRAASQARADMGPMFQAAQDLINGFLAHTEAPGIVDSISDFIFGSTPVVIQPVTPGSTVPAVQHTSSAMLSPLLIGGVVLGFLLMSRKGR